MGITTIVWLTVTYCTNPEPKELLLSFYRRVRPSPGFWGQIAKEAVDVVPTNDGIFNLVDWLSGVAMIYSFLFGIGKIILGETVAGCIFLAAGIVFGGIIYIDLNKRGWETVGKWIIHNFRGNRAILSLKIIFYHENADI
jgi:TM2 domain-containing membrane protein YozV